MLHLKDLKDPVDNQVTDYLALLELQYRDLVDLVVLRVEEDLRVTKDLQHQKVSKVSKDRQPLQEFLETKDLLVIRVLKETLDLQVPKVPVVKKVRKVTLLRETKAHRVIHPKDQKVT